MSGLIQPLTLQSGAVVVALVSAILAFAWTRFSTTLVNWLLGLSAPLALSYCLYWSPTWLGASPSEYAAWAPLFIAPWYVAGAAASLLVVHLDAARRRRHTTSVLILSPRPPSPPCPPPLH